MGSFDIAHSFCRQDGDFFGITVQPHCSCDGAAGGRGRTLRINFGLATHYGALGPSHGTFWAAKPSMRSSGQNEVRPRCRQWQYLRPRFRTYVNVGQVGQVGGACAVARGKGAGHALFEQMPSWTFAQCPGDAEAGDCGPKRVDLGNWFDREQKPAPAFGVERARPGHAEERSLSTAGKGPVGHTVGTVP